MNIVSTPFIQLNPTKQTVCFVVGSYLDGTVKFVEVELC